MVEYHRMFAVLEQRRDKQVIPECEGVDRDAMVCPNGAFSGQRLYEYAVFTVDAAPFSPRGADNVIRMECRVHQDSR